MMEDVKRYLICKAIKHPMKTYRYTKILWSLPIIGAPIEREMKYQTKQAVQNKVKEVYQNNKKTLTIGAGVIAAAGIFYLAKHWLNSRKKDEQVRRLEDAVKLETIPELGIYEDSLWIKEDSNQFGAEVVEYDSKQLYEVTYKTEQIADKSYNIYLYSDDKWTIVGSINWAKTRLEELGRPSQGGPLFAEIAYRVFYALADEGSIT